MACNRVLPENSIRKHTRSFRQRNITHAPPSLETIARTTDIESYGLKLQALTKNMACRYSRLLGRNDSTGCCDPELSNNTISTPIMSEESNETLW
jgi:hypothetical protein